MRSASRAAVFAAAVAAVSCTGASIAFAGTAPEAKAASSATTFDNSLIARTALKYVGLWGGQACIDAHHAAFGQCKQFVNCVVSLASEGRLYPVDPDGDYQASFADVGGVEVQAPNAVTGDIVQVGEHDDDTVLHTAIVLVNHHNGSFTVVDANYVDQPEQPEMVGVHEWTPPTGSRFWRLGTVSAALPADLTKMIKQVSKLTLPVAPDAPTLSTAVPAGIASGTVAVDTLTPADGSAATAERLWVDGHSYATYPVAALDPTVQLDTTKIPDGVHHLRAQAVSPFGAVSSLGPDLTLTVANKTPVVAAIVPPGVAAGTVTLGAVTSPAAAKDVLSVSVDGKPPTGPGLQVDTSALTPGAHTVAIVAAGADGKPAATSAPAPMVTGPATSQRVAIDINNTGRSDLIALDSSGHVVRYAPTGDGTFGRAQVIDPAQAHGTIRLLAAGHFATADSPAQLLAVWSDGSAHLYTFDVDGSLGDDTLVGGTVQWASIAHLAVRNDGRLLATGADGSQSVITFALAQVPAPAVTDTAAVDAAAGAGPAGSAGPAGTAGTATAPGGPSSGPSGSAGPGAPTTSPSAGAASGPTSAATGQVGPNTPTSGSTGGNPGKDSGKNAAGGHHAASDTANGPGTPGVPTPSPSGAPSGSAAPGGGDGTAGAPGVVGATGTTGTPGAPGAEAGVDATDNGAPTSIGGPGSTTVDPATVPGVIAVAVPLTPPPAPAPSSKATTAKSGTSKSSKSSGSTSSGSTSSGSSTSTKSSGKSTTPTPPARTPVNAVTGRFTADGVLEVLTTYSDGTSDIKPAAPPVAPPAANAPAVQPLAAVFATDVVTVADASLIHHMAAMANND